MDCVSFPEQNITVGIGDCDPAKVVPMPAWVGEDQRGDSMSVSCWKLTPEELVEVQRTGVVWQGIMGKGIPPSYVAAFSPFQPYIVGREGKPLAERIAELKLVGTEPARKWKAVEWKQGGWRTDQTLAWNFEVSNDLAIDYYVFPRQEGDGWEWIGTGSGRPDENQFAGNCFRSWEPAKPCATMEEAKREAEKHFYEQLDTFFTKWSI